MHAVTKKWFATLSIYIHLIPLSIDHYTTDQQLRWDSTANDKHFCSLKLKSGSDKIPSTF